MKINKDAAFQAHLVLRELNAFLEAGTPVHPGSLYSEDETFAQAVARVLRMSETKVTV